MSETVHATCVRIDGAGVLLTGRSGSGKSDLALRLLDRGAALVSDDYTIVANRGGRLMGSAPDTIAGKIEVRGIGIVEWPTVAEVEVLLAIILDEPVERMPPDPLDSTAIDGVTIPLLRLSAFEASAPIKAELAARAASAARAG